MKIAAVLSFFLIGSWVQAQSLQVPEDCLTTKTAPCLAHVKSFTDKPIDLGSYQVVASADTIMKWTSFEGDVAVELVKGKIQLRRLLKKEGEPKTSNENEHGAQANHENEKHGGPSHENNHELSHESKLATKGEAVAAMEESLHINGILVKSAYVMVHKDNDVIKILELKKFSVSDYDLTNVKQSPILIKSHLATKTEVVFFAAPFFKTKNKFLSFLKTVEKPFAKQLEAQTEAQTIVLKRALASVEEENKVAADKKAAADAKLKKVREQFFYRTFYR